jgi:hypothetical protein
MSPPKARTTDIKYEDLLVDADNQQWVLDMVNIPRVWEQEIFGTGVRVRVNDDGVDRTNPHWIDRFDAGASCDISQEPASSTKFHGTSVASIIGASNSNENTCTIGITPGVILSSCYALSPDESFLGTKIDQIDISSNSFERPACRAYSETSAEVEGHRSMQAAECPFVHADLISQYDPCLVCDNFSFNIGYLDNTVKSPECVEAILRHCSTYYEVEKEACSAFLDLIIGGECDYVGLSTVARTSISKGVTEGRGGKGIVYIFAAGNAHYEGDDTNLKGYTSSVCA